MQDKCKVLVTGGCGFIGSHVVDELIKNNYEVCVLDIARSNYINNKVKYYEVNIIEDELHTIFECEKPNVVIHLAAQTSVNVSVNEPLKDCLYNVYGTLNVLEACKKSGVSKIIAASTAAIYGNPKYLPIDETHDLIPMSPYGLSKKVMEEYIKISDLNYMIFRFSNVYGERQAYGGESGVISIFINNLIKNKPVIIYGDGEQFRDFIYVKDVSKCIVKSIESKYKNEIINLSTQTKISINELFNMIRNIIGSNVQPKYVNQRLGDIKESILCNDKMIDLGFRYETSLATGLKNTVKFFKQNQ